MAALMVATIHMKDPAKFSEYARQAGPVVKQWGGEFLARGKREATLTGSATNDATAIIRFPDTKTIADWYNPPEYQALIPLRDAGADVTFVSYSVPE